MKTIYFDHDNVPGIANILAVPANYTLHADKGVLTLKDSDSIISIPVYDNDSFRFNEKMTIQGPGPLYEVDVAGIMPAPKDQNQELIKELTFGYWRVIVTDANGTVRVFGTVDIPLLFSYTNSVGRSSMNGYSFTFAGAQSKPALTYGSLSIL